MFSVMFIVCAIAVAYLHCGEMLMPKDLVIGKGVARLQFKRRQSGPIKHWRRVSQGVQGAEGDGARGGVSPPRQGRVWVGVGD